MPLPPSSFLPTTPEELLARGWKDLDVILVSGDAYVDTPYSGIALVGRALEARGFRVGIIGQPAVATLADIQRLGPPRLFWGVSSGSVDSMVANYTASGKPRRSDDFTPGGINNRRPDRACIAYANLIRRAFRPCAPIILGGIEASLRRIAHYDFWSNTIRRSVLLDAKADAIVYGMGERTVCELAARLRDGQPWQNLPGLCHVAATLPEGAIELPAYEVVAPTVTAESPAAALDARHAFMRMTLDFLANQDWHTAKPLAQRHDRRWLVQNPPAEPLRTEELNAVYRLPFQREAHPFDAAQGAITGLETVRFAITTHRGCYGECNFCAIAAHQGRGVNSRSEAAILEEAAAFTRHPRFRGVISDVGGPTANMYGFACSKLQNQGACADRRCLFPTCCPNLKPDHAPLTRLLTRLRNLPGVRHVFVGSGIRHDLVVADARNGEAYLETLTTHHVSGQLKLAPEHSEPRVLELMGKPDTSSLLQFKARFDAITRRLGKPQFLTYYLIAAHPGSTEDDMRRLRDFAQRNLHLLPEQVQIFTPTPSTLSTAMYCTGLDPATGAPIFVARGGREREQQKLLLAASR
jgi:uncharacterized radical SAM protein YgiQ